MADLTIRVALWTYLLVTVTKLVALFLCAVVLRNWVAAVMSLLAPLMLVHRVTAVLFLCRLARRWARAAPCRSRAARRLLATVAPSAWLLVPVTAVRAVVSRCLPAPRALAVQRVVLCLYLLAVAAPVASCP